MGKIVGVEESYKTQKCRLCDSAIGFQISLLEMTIKIYHLSAKFRETVHRSQDSSICPAYAVKANVPGHSII